MVKVTGPCHSHAASGSVASTLVFSNNKKVNYVRQLSVPRDPRSGSQVSFRALTAMLSQQWEHLSPSDQQTWEPDSLTRGNSPFNAYSGVNTSAWNINQPPSKRYPAALSSPPAQKPSLFRQAFVKRIRLIIASFTPAPTWGWVVYRSLIPGYTPAPSDVVAFFPTLDRPSYFNDAPLPSGVEHYYHVRGFNTDGVFGIMSTERHTAPL